MFKFLPLLLLTHNLDQSQNCIGPCFGSMCPTGMACYNGECCEEPFSDLSFTTKPIQPVINRIITPSATASPPIDNRIRPTCVDVSPSCRSIYHLCMNVLYEIVMVKNCAHTCNKCHSFPNTSNTQNSRITCLDYGRNCNNLKHLCSNTAYSSLLQRVCQKTCLCS